MGHGTFDTASYTARSESERKGKPVSMKYAQRQVKKELDAAEIEFRESRDSDDNPKATPIMVGLDVTASMGDIADTMADQALGTLMSELMQRQPVPDPHLLFMGIGDAVAGDRSPLQATQFEADNAIDDQLVEIWLEHGGGGNNYESYDLAWLFAALRTRSDAWDKRKEKGFLFTVGDEMYPQESSQRYCKAILGNDCPQQVTPNSLYEMANERYHIFHVIVQEGNYAQRMGDKVLGAWRQKLGKRALPLSDHTKVAEVIVSAIAVEHGADIETTINSWDQNTAGVVRTALTTDEVNA